MVQPSIASVAQHRGARRFPWPALRLSLRPGARKLASSLLPSMATARIRPWPGPVIAPDVHDPACLRQLRLSFVRKARAGWYFTSKAPLERSPNVPPRVTWFRFGRAECAAVKLERWPKKNARMEAACVQANSTCGHSFDRVTAQLMSGVRFVFFRFLLLLVLTKCFSEEFNQC